MSSKTVSTVLMFLLVLGTLALAVRIQPVKAAMIIVPDDYPTIQGAVNKADTGDTILVRSGVYYEQVSINKSLTLLGENQNTIVDGNGTGTVFVVSQSYTTISGFTIRNAGGGILMASDTFGWPEDGGSIENITISNNLVENCSTGVCSTGGGYHDRAPSAFTMTNNTISGSTIGLYCDGGTGTISGNQIINNVYGIRIGYGSFNIKDNLICYSNNGIYNEMGGDDGYEISYVANDNRISGNSRAIFLQPGIAWGTLYNNTIDQNIEAVCLSTTDNEYYGDYVANFYSNNFVDNIEQLHYEVLETNEIAWNETYPVGGNYWSIFSGTDVYSGPYQNITGSDGFIDTPYQVGLNDWDYYPCAQNITNSAPTIPQYLYPLARFTYSPATPAVNDTLTFNASTSVALASSILSYDWSFGDGSSLNETSPITTHSYTTVGSYNVTLTVVDNNGRTNQESTAVPIGKQTSAITIATNPSTITIRMNTTINGQITPSRPGVNVTIYDKLGNESNWETLATVATDKNGIYSYEWTPSEVGTYQLEANWTGDEYTQPAESSNITLDCVKIVSSISVSTSSSSTIVGFRVTISGRLTDEYDNALSSKLVVLYYTSYGVGTWYLITSVYTDAFGNYSAMWIPSATGTFMIEAIWDGNTTDAGVSNNVTLCSLPYQDQYVFSVESNSTVSDLVLDTSQNILSFSVSGPDGTSGYTRVTMAKSLIIDPTKINVHIDGVTYNYTLTETSDSWILTFTYEHSSHTVEINLEAAIAPSPVLSLVVRGMDGRIYYRASNGTDWGGWNVLPGSTMDTPAAAVIGNQLHVVVRGSDGSSLWYGYLTNVSDSGSFSGWILLSGVTSSAPTLTSNGTTLCLVVRGLDNRIYYRFYTVATLTWTSWSVLPSGTTLNSPTASLVGNGLHIVVRGTDGSTLWYSNVNQTTDVFSGWTLLTGSTPSIPTLTSNSTTLALVVRGGDNRIYTRFYTIATQAWTSWTTLPSGTTQDSPAATIVQNTLYIVVKGSDGSSLWQSSIDIRTSAFSGWTMLSGSTPSKPTLTS